MNCRTPYQATDNIQLTKLVRGNQALSSTMHGITEAKFVRSLDLRLVMLFWLGFVHVGYTLLDA